MYGATSIRSLTLVATTVSALQGCAAAPPDSGAERLLGALAQVGNATASSYAELDDTGTPTAIGLVFGSDFFGELPTEPSDLRRCADRDENGVIDRPAECSAWHEWVIPLPSEIARRADIPFKWSLLNWNPAGHIPPGVYDVPHFDMHFYMEPIESVFALEPGTCGPEFIRCDQFERAVEPLPARYLAPDYENVDAAAPAMGNHLIDLTSPEFGGEPFTRTWIYGVYEGRVTFYEEMLTRDYLLSQPDECFPIKRAEAVEIAGYYPTLSCIRYRPESDEYTVSMEGFELRPAA